MALCSQYSPAGNMYDGSGRPVFFKANVKRTACMGVTKDDWCSACSGGKCTACYPRNYGAGGTGEAITLDPASGKARRGLGGAAPAWPGGVD